MTLQSRISKGIAQSGPARLGSEHNAARWAVRSRVLGAFGLLLLAAGLAAQSTKPAVPDAPPPPVKAPEAARAVDTSGVKGDPAQELGPLLGQFLDVLSVIQSQGPEQQSLDKLVYEGAIPSMLRQLDPHTQFFDPGQFEQLRNMEDSEQKGFGSVVSVLPGQVIFLQTLPGTPSNRAGIQAGDELVAINNIGIGNLDPEHIIQLLTEARQQKIMVFVRRQGAPRVLQFALAPELVDAPSVDRAFMVQPKFGYIRIASWDLQTAKQLQAAIEKLGADSLSGLVIDLRNNPGGVVKAALDGASMFLQPGQKILTAKGRTSEVETANVPQNAHPYKFKVAVLINEKTASASEILSGALQDHDRAVIVGVPSYGKGLVQSVMPLSGGSGLAITTAFYYTPSGRSIQRPLRNSRLSDTFGEAPANQSADKQPTYKTDDGRVVTGGGGIQPDLHVYPESYTQLEAVLNASGTLTSFATTYLAKHPQIPDPIEVTTDMLDDLRVYLVQRQIQPSLAEWSTERAWVTNRLKEEIVTQARGVEKGDQIQAAWDPQIQAALRAMKENTMVAERVAERP